MDLLLETSGVIDAVNPRVAATLRTSTGATQNADFSRTPTYAAPVTVMAQVQPLTTGDLRKLDALNIQGVNRAIYIEGAVNGLVRVTGQGGDLITIPAPGPNAGVYLVKAVLEAWPNWAKCAVVLQDGS
jgi:hypothetical protein